MVAFIYAEFFSVAKKRVPASWFFVFRAGSGFFSLLTLMIKERKRENETG